jgi:hypothetical protein
MSAQRGPEATSRDETELGRSSESESCDEELTHLFGIPSSYLKRSSRWLMDGREQPYSVLQAHMHMMANGVGI